MPVIKLKEIIVAVLVDLWVSGRVYGVCGKIGFFNFSTDEVGTYPQIHKYILLRGRF